MIILVCLGCPPAAILHFLIVKISVPDNPTTELDIMSLSCVAPELCHFQFLDKMAAILDLVLDFVAAAK